MAQRHYFTSITNNYIPKARVLGRSIREHDPDGILHLVLCDVPPAGFDLEREPFHHLHLVRDLDIPDTMSWIFRHSVVEMCTGVKGPALWKILNDFHADEVYYFDPDMVVLTSLARLHAQLADASVVLTPHQVEPESNDEDVRINEMTSLKHGTYNLGFIGVRRTAAGLAFARWWRDRLLSWCRNDIPNGLFTDQRWCDLAPAYFDGVRILRDKQYNVATWNLTHRKVVLGDGGRLLVDGQPLVFFHFSGFDSGGQLMMLRHYAPADSPLFELRNWYLRALDEAGQAELGALESVYARYFNGVPIEQAHRVAYRDRQDLIERFPFPFDVDVEYCFYDWVRHEMPHQVPPVAPAASTVAPQVNTSVDELKASITWRVGRLITGPIETVAARLPGVVPAIKRRLRG